MSMESSSRSPDSSCPDYYPYDTSLGHANRDQSSSSVDILISSSTGNSLSSTFGIHFQSHLGNNRNGQIPEDLSRSQSYQNNGKSVINFAVGRNDQLSSTPESSSRGQSFQNSRESVSNFPTVRSQWRGSSSALDNLSGLSSANYQNSSLSSGIGIDNFYKTTVEQVRTSHNPPTYSQPEMPYLTSTSSMLTASKTTPEIAPLPKIEHSRVSSSVSSNSNYLSIPPSNSNYVNSARQPKTNILGDQIIPKTTKVSRGFTNIYPQRHDTFWSASHVPQYVSSYDLNPDQPETSAKSSCVERGLKRKSSPVLNNSGYLSSAPSSSSNYVDKEQSISNESKKNKVHDSSSYLELDDDIQIIMPETSKSHSSASGSSLSTSSYHKPSVSFDGSRLSSLNSSKQTKPKLDHNPLLDSQSSHLTTQDRSSTIHNPLSAEELEQMLDSVWSDFDEIATSANVTSTAGSTPGTESDESSSSSIISVHEVVKDANSFEMNKRQSPILEKVSNEIPTLITLDSSPKISEELTPKQEAENVKEDFKRLIEDELICNICTEVLIKPITLGCSHTFCKFCISEWKEKKRQCPMCRAHIVTETPCLFLDNFISKAVEQLDPASVEKRVEIIQSREEQQKKKMHKPPVQLPQSSNVPQDTLLNTLQFNRILNSEQQRPNRVSQINFSYLLGRTPDTVQRRSIILRRPSTIFQQPLNIPHQSSSIPQISPSLTPLSSSIPQISSSLTPLSSSIPQQASSVSQRSSSIPQQFPNLHQPNLFHGPTNGYFYWK